ncbi:MAG: PQQ-like beta-propeller repeat protein [Verrucomicrobiae bacterium]|nr:PQQ-like beta-propeller repeat protein [Verrucomicrobiae bacterium]
MSTPPNQPPDPAPTVPGLRVWPAALIAVLAAAALFKIQVLDREAAFQHRNLATAAVALLTFTALLLWWTLLSRAPRRQRRIALAAVTGLMVLSGVLFRIRGVSGDFVPIWEPRWSRTAAPAAVVVPSVSAPAPTGSAPGIVGETFPQFLGPNRNGRIAGPSLDTRWAVQPPVIAWRQPVGPAWSGFVVAGGYAVTQEQQGAEEQVTAYDRASGRRLWTHADPERYATTIAGEGPRATPALQDGRVFSLGATGRLNALDLATGRLLWTRSLTADAACSVPEWGFSGSPLVHEGLVVVSAGGREGASMIAYRADSGELAWKAGDSGAGYASPFLATLSGTPQILILNHRSFASHDPATGAVRWEVPFGAGLPLVANPIETGPDRVLISAGYNVGAELFAVGPGTHAPTSLWKSRKLKAKFANPVYRDGHVYGLDDGILVCLDVRDGSQPWKEGRYGHGQGLLVNDLYLLMAESGEMVLLRPTPEGPNELGRLRIFNSKTWNPIALAGADLLVRNDQEAALVRLPLATSAPASTP